MAACLAGKIPKTNPTVVDTPSARITDDSETTALYGIKAEIIAAIPQSTKTSNVSYATRQFTRDISDMSSQYGNTRPISG